MSDIKNLLAMMQPKLGVQSPADLPFQAGGPVSADRVPVIPAQPMNQTIRNSQSVSVRGPSVGGGSQQSQVDALFFKQLMDRQNQVEQMQQEQGQLKNYEPGFQDANLKPLLAFADQLAGTNSAASYTAPTSNTRRANKIDSLGENIMKSQNAIGDDQLAYLKEKAYEQKLNRMMAGATKNPGQDALDRKFATDYEDWSAIGGYSTAERHLNAIDQAIKALEKDPTLTGAKHQITPDGLRKIFNPQSVAIQQQIENAVMGSLRATLGAQFTENEGKRILNLSYDPSLPASVNVAKLKALLQEQTLKAREKDAASQYFQSSKGTLRGYMPGNLSSTQSPVAPQGQVKEWNGKKYALQGDEWVEVK